MPLRYGLDEEQQLIADSADRVFRDLFPSAAVRDFMRAPMLSAQWREGLAESGLLGICAPADSDGAGLGAGAALAILVAAGRRVAPWPVAESIVAAALLAESHPSIARAVARAESIVAFAPDTLHATRSGNRVHSADRIDAVAWAPLADWLVSEVTLHGARQCVLFDLRDDGIRCEPRKSIDPCCPMARVVLNDATAEVIGAADARWSALRTLFAAAEMVGAAQTCLELSVDYMKVRKQFGQPIGRFQALKHIAANDALYLESMRLAVEYAAWAQDARAEDAAMALHIAKQYCSQQARTVAEDAVQCHGGIGFTWDYDLHLYLRRIVRLGASHGTTSEHREAIAAALEQTVAQP